MEMKKIGWENGTLVEPAKVLSDGTVQPAQYEGKTPLNASNLTQMENNTEEFVVGNIGDLTTLETTNKDNVVSSINELNNVKSLRLKKLWENSNPSGEMSIVDIPLNSNDYDYLLWIYKPLNYVNLQKSEICLKGSSVNFSFIENYQENGTWQGIEGISRGIDYVNDTAYKTRNAEVLRQGIATYVTFNGCVPIAVYGGKF